MIQMCVVIVLHSNYIIYCIEMQYPPPINAEAKKRASRLFFGFWALRSPEIPPRLRFGAATPFDCVPPRHPERSRNQSVARIKLHGVKFGISAGLRSE